MTTANLDYTFNFSFTRADENHAHVYSIGTHVLAPTELEARIELAERNAHVTVLESTIRLFAVFTLDGDLVESYGNEERFTTLKAAVQLAARPDFSADSHAVLTNFIDAYLINVTRLLDAKVVR